MSDTNPDRPTAPSGAPDPAIDEPPFYASSAWFDPRAPRPAQPAPFPAPAPRLTPPPPPRARRHGWRYALVGLAAGALGAGLVAGAFLLWFDQGSSGQTALPIETRIIEGTGAVQAAEVARIVLPSIVTVEVQDATGAEASGSGVVLTADGLLVTNAHVVAGAAQVRVVFAGGRAYSAEVVGLDAVTDLAVLRIAASGLIPIALGSSEDLEIGDPAIAVGSPLGLQGGPSVTVGVVSAFDRQLQTGADEALFGLIQTDAPITRGSSGGALVDSAGRLIGITAAIGISDVGAEGLGFAIPVELMTVVTDQIIAQGRADHPFLGIQGTTYFRQEADGSTVPAGVAVDKIFENTAAEAAGVEAGDIILSVAGEPLATMEQLVVMVRFYRVGEIVELEIDRGGVPMTIPVTLMERPEGV
ncbi:MAG: S1C family serine protease [Acidimicrobiia bacterium]|nr:S1C family serine protease [Acidimicrobiia bacterium]